MSDKLVVMLATEGTYPFHQGGVSTWCDILVKQLKSVDYVIYSVLMDPYVTQKFKLPGGAGLLKMPLWGTEEPSEHLTIPFSQVYLAKQRTTVQAVRDHFIPLFTELLEEIVSPVKNPHRFADTVYALYQYFQQYEYKATFKSELAWDTYKNFMLSLTRESGQLLATPDIYSLIQSMGWIYRFFNIINTPVPKAHVSHASAAAFCGLPCVIAKKAHHTPFLLTEHGVYLREQYLSLSKREYSSFLNTFLMRFIHSITSMNYAFADQVSPVCEYNTRWEKQFGVDDGKIKVIYNGVDKRVFAEAAPSANSSPTVVSVARIDPLKDIVTLIRAAAIVKLAIPDVQFVVYGSVTVQDYYEECVRLRDELGLGHSFVFAGHTVNMAAAYQSGDVIALSSISEAFPYSVVEAMMTGKPVVSTDVGGIKEALGDCGILVRPREPEELANGLVRLLRDAALRDALGKDARERALNFFTLEKVLEHHLKSYVKLAAGISEPTALTASQRPDRSRRTAARHQLTVEKAYALAACGLYREAIAQFRQALRDTPDTAEAPVYLIEIAAAYNELGEYDRAFLELERFHALVHVLETKRSA